MEEQPVYKERICIDCGEVFQPHEPTRLCPKCHIVHKEKNNARHKVWREARQKQGLCCYSKTCKEKSADGHTVCEEHLRIVREKSLARQKRLASISIKKPEPLTLFDSEDQTCPSLGSSKINKLQPLFKKLESIDEQIRTLGSERESIVRSIDELVK